MPGLHVCERLTLFQSQTSKTDVCATPGLGIFLPSEHELDGQLNPARTAAAQEGIPDAHIAGFREREKVDAPPRNGVDAVKTRVGREARIKRAGEVGMVRQVVELRPELDREAFSDGRVLEDGEVELAVVGPAQRVSSERSGMLGTLHTRISKTVAPAGQKRTGRLERA